MTESSTEHKQAIFTKIPNCVKCKQKNMPYNLNKRKFDNYDA